MFPTVVYKALQTSWFCVTNDQKKQFCNFVFTHFNCPLRTYGNYLSTSIMTYLLNNFSFLGANQRLLIKQQGVFKCVKKKKAANFSLLPGGS